MKFTLSDKTAAAIETDCLILAVPREGEFPEIVAAADRAAGGLICRLRSRDELPRKAGKVLMVHTGDGAPAQRLLLCGTGDPAKLSRVTFKQIALAAGKALRESRATEAYCALPLLDVRGTDPAWRLRESMLALDFSDYIYTATKQPAADAPPATATVSLPADCGDQAVIAQGEAIAAGVARCRELAELPPNIVTPAYLAEVAGQLAARYQGLECEVLDEAQMEQIGMHALLAVGQGSANPSRLIVLKWRGAEDAGEAPYVLVGKGVTFDTGGISLKARENMDQMKYDMGGAAAAIGVLEACARIGLKRNVIAVVPAVENMPDGRAYRPGDILKSLSGQTIEVLNTDAEGRLILCDALTWAERYNSRATVDIATLTGAAVVALGHEASVVMSPHDDLAEELLAAGEHAADRAWRLPLWDEYQPLLDTPFADVKNMGDSSAGTIAAGCFLSRFTGKQRWAHLDIAGTAWKWGPTESATGRPVGLLCQWLLDR